MIDTLALGEDRVRLDLLYLEQDVADDLLLVPVCSVNRPVVLVFDVDFFLNSKRAFHEEVDEILCLTLFAEALVLVENALLHFVHQTVDSVLVPGLECEEVVRDALLSLIPLLVDFLHVDIDVGLLTHVEYLGRLF